MPNIAQASHSDAPTPKVPLHPERYHAKPYACLLAGAIRSDLPGLLAEISEDKVCGAESGFVQLCGAPVAQEDRAVVS